MDPATPGPDDVVPGTAVELVDQPVGAVLAPEADGTPRYVCACHLVRSRPAFGRGVVRAVWSGFLVPIAGVALVALAVLVVVRSNEPVLRMVVVVLLALLAGGAVLGGRSGGHRGWCAARTSAYWFVAFPAVLLGAFSSF